MPKPSSSPPPSDVIATLKNFFTLLFVSIGAGLRKTPTTLVLVLIGLFIYFRSPEEANKSEPSQFEEPIPQEEPQPPADLSLDVSPAFWTCIASPASGTKTTTTVSTRFIISSSV